MCSLTICFPAGGERGAEERVERERSGELGRGGGILPVAYTPFWQSKGKEETKGSKDMVVLTSSDICVIHFHCGMGKIGFYLFIFLV